MNWYRRDGARDSVEIDVHVQPNASRTRCVGMHGDAVKIQVAAVPEDGRANAALCEFVAARLRVPGRSVSVKRGAASRRKTLALADLPPGMTPDALLAALQG
jgi:uncharacterized protein